MKKVYNLVHMGKGKEPTEAVQSLNIKVLLCGSIDLCEYAVC